MFQGPCVVLLLSAAALAQNPLLQFAGDPWSKGPVVIASDAGCGTRTWVTVPVPYQDALELPELASFVSEDGTPYPAVRATRVGYHTVFYDVLVDLPPYAVLRGGLESSWSGPENPRFAPSPWVVDELWRTIPRVRVRIGGETYWSEITELRPVLSTVARQTWQQTARCGPLVIHLWTHVWSGQDVIEWQLYAVNSDPRLQSVEVELESFQVFAGEPILVEDGVALGIDPPSYDCSNEVWSFELLREPVTVGDAQALPILRGALLCTASELPWYHNFFSDSRAVTGRMSRLLSRTEGQPVAGRRWSGRWLAFQATVPAHAQDRRTLDATYGRQHRMLCEPQQLFAQRMRGLLKDAGSPGVQQDFGASKGAELTLGDLRFGRTWHYHTQEPMRPFHYRELLGDLVRGGAHADWVTWSQVTHWHCQVSRDRLGKPCPAPAPNTHGWTGKDDQHMSSNGLHAAVAAFDWPAHRMLVEEEANVAHANVRFLSGQGPGAPRAVGRRMLADANRWLLTGREQDWERLVVWHGRNAFEKSFRPTRDWHTHAGPTTDPRVMVDPASGEPVPAIVVWQEGLAMKGLAAAWAAHLYRQRLGLPTVPGTERIGDQLVRVASTVTRHCFARVGDRWQTWLNIGWNGGIPDPSLIARSRDLPGRINGLVEVESSWFLWIASGLYYLARAEHGLAVPADVAARLDSIASEWERRVGPDATIEQREWFAVVQR